MMRNLFRDDGYRGPKLVVIGIVVVMLSVAVYLFQASRQAAKAGGNEMQSSHVRQVDQAVRDAEEALAGRTPRHRRGR